MTSRLLAETCQDLYYLAFPEDRPLNKVLVYGVYLVETVQTMILLYNGIPTYNFQSTYALPEQPDDVNLWVALSLLGGIGMFTKIDTDVGDSLPQTSKLHLSSNRFTRIVFASSRAHGLSSPSLFWYDFLVLTFLQLEHFLNAITGSWLSSNSFYP